VPDYAAPIHAKLPRTRRYFSGLASASSSSSARLADAERQLGARGAELHLLPLGGVEPAHLRDLDPSPDHGGGVCLDPAELDSCLKLLDHTLTVELEAPSRLRLPLLDRAGNVSVG